MRTHILIATALILSATAAHAAPRSLSGAQTNPVETPVQRIQVLEAPQPIEAPRADELPRTELPKAAEQAPIADPGPVHAAPIENKPVATRPAEAAPVAAAPAEASPAPAAEPVKQARRKQPRRHVTTEQRLEREFRAMGRTIERHIGFALSNATLYHW